MRCAIEALEDRIALAGDGLNATYYNNKDFTGSSVTRVDSRVDFSWKNGSPASAIGRDTFSARWTGWVEPQHTQSYTFHTRSDDGVRLWVDGRLLINNWTAHSVTENSGSITLAADRRYEIRLDYFEERGGAQVQLLWSGASTPKSVVPQSRLYTVETTPAPIAFLDRDVGAVGATGSLSTSDGIYTIKGSGADIWGTADAFHYAYIPLDRDGHITARVRSEQNTDGWAKAGVMIRESLAANAEYASMFVTPGNGLVFQQRASTGGGSVTTSGSRVSAPYWVKLVRSGNDFIGYQSANGRNWIKVGSSTIAMGADVYVGLAVTSHNNSTLNTSVFDNVSIREPASRDSIVRWYTIGGGSTDLATRRIGYGIPTHGWSPFISGYVRPELNYGHRRIIVHNPFGTLPEQVQFDQYIHAREAGLTNVVNGFVEAWKPITDQGIEVIAYIGSPEPSYDPDFARLRGPDKRDQWLARVNESLQPMLDAGMSIALDASAMLPSDSATHEVAQMLRSRGVKVYIEERPYANAPHWWSYSWITDYRNYQDPPAAVHAPLEVLTGEVIQAFLGPPDASIGWDDRGWLEPEIQKHLRNDHSVAASVVRLGYESLELEQILAI